MLENIVNAVYCQDYLKKNQTGGLLCDPDLHPSYQLAGC